MLDFRRRTTDALIGGDGTGGNDDGDSNRRRRGFIYVYLASTAEVGIDNEVGSSGRRYHQKHGNKYLKPDTCRRRLMLDARNISMDVDINQQIE